MTNVKKRAEYRWGEGVGGISGQSKVVLFGGGVKKHLSKLVRTFLEKYLLWQRNDGSIKRIQLFHLWLYFTK